MPIILFLQKIIKRRPFMIKTLENVMKKRLLQSLMPVIDGYEACQTIREYEKEMSWRTAIVASSANVSICRINSLVRGSIIARDSAAIVTAVLELPEGHTLTIDSERKGGGMSLAWSRQDVVCEPAEAARSEERVTESIALVLFLKRIVQSAEVMHVYFFPLIH